MSQSPTSSTQQSDSYDSGWEQILDLVNTGGSWSGHERNCCFLNIDGSQFADVSAVTGLDFLDDGRSIAPVDWDLDGDLDLWLSARTGPRLRFVRNDIRDAKGAGEGNHFLAVKLVGKSCNRDAIGARVEATVNGQRLLRTLYAGHGYLAQSSKWIHFGLGNATEIDELLVRWPGGDVEAFDGLRLDAHFELVQGTGQATEWQPPQREVALQPVSLETRKDSTPSRIVLFDRVPLPTLDYIDFKDQEASIPADAQGPVLVSLWANWCEPCLFELRDIKNAEQRLRDHGLEVVALTVDGIEDGDLSAITKARQFIERIEFPFKTGKATTELVDKLDGCQDVFISLRRQKGQLPSSFLVDRQGRLAVVYPGPINVDQLLADVRQLDAPGHAKRQAAFPFPGRWFASPQATGEVLLEFAKQMDKRGHTADALSYAGLAADLATRGSVPPKTMFELATIFFAAGNASLEARQLDDARRHLTEAVRLQPAWAEAHSNLGSVYGQLNSSNVAEQHYRIALQSNPRLLQANFNLGVIRLQQRNNREAAIHFRITVDVNREFAEGHNYLGVALARLGHAAESLRHLETAVRLAPNNSNARRNRDAVVAGEMP